MIAGILSRPGRTCSLQRSACSTGSTWGEPVRLEPCHGGGGRISGQGRGRLCSRGLLGQELKRRGRAAFEHARPARLQTGPMLTHVPACPCCSTEGLRHRTANIGQVYSFSHAAPPGYKECQGPWVGGAASRLGRLVHSYLLPLLHRGWLRAGCGLLGTACLAAVPREPAGLSPMHLAGCCCPARCALLPHVRAKSGNLPHLPQQVTAPGQLTHCLPTPHPPY